MNILVASEGASCFSRKRKKLFEMFSNYDYMNWLEDFVWIHRKFSDDTWLNHPEKISKADYDKVLDLPLFFEGVENFARTNRFFPYFEKYSYYCCYFLIRYKTTVYKVSMSCGKGTVFSFEKSENDMSKKIIDFKDVIENPILEPTYSIAKNLNDYLKEFDKLIDTEVPS